MNDHGELLARDVVQRWLACLLPEGWSVRVMASHSGGPPTSVQLVPRTGQERRLAIEMISGTTAEVLDLINRPIISEVVVLASWLNPRACEALRNAKANFVDATGNIRLVLDDPVVFVDRVGAVTQPRDVDEVILRRRKATRFLRYLIDEAPRQRVKELAAATDLSTGYVSQLLHVLESRDLVRRGRRGRLESVSIDGLLVQYAESYEAQAFCEVTHFSTSSTIPAILERLGSLDGHAVITGATAASRLTGAPAPRTLTLYVADARHVAAELGLVRVRHAGGVVLMQPTESFLTDRACDLGGLSYAAVPQVVADCFDASDAGSGEAALRWALANVCRWREPTWPSGSGSPVPNGVPYTASSVLQARAAVDLRESNPGLLTPYQSEPS